ncbi:MAG: hypothetical protein QOE70_4399 [Chthoniobacter sp.]|jgi:hypothetical protein|nr:hypothetical protein [Chthoniobacter sp.]
MNARKSSLFLFLIGRLKPEAWDAIHPHGPRVSIASREYMVAMAVKGFSSELENRAVVQKLAGVQKTLVKFATERLAADYDDDNWCPTGRVPIPIPVPGPLGFSFDEVMLNPQPLPPKELQKEIGGYLVMLAGATSLASVAKELEAVGKSLLRKSSR